MIVITIILAITVAVLPGIVASLREHPVVSGAQILQAAIVQARDASIAGEPRGVRLEPESVTRLATGEVDPDRPLVCSRIVPIAVPPAYQEGQVSISPTNIYPAALTGGRPCLVLEESPGRWEANGARYIWIPNPPTSWAWNVRAGETIVLGTGSRFTVCGPLAVLPGAGNPEAFVNYGPAGTPALTRTYAAPDGTTVDVNIEILLLINGQDDDNDGFIDEGWDGIDNDADGVVDELDEWEQEKWAGIQAAAFAGRPYKILRRPIPGPGGQAIELPNPAVIDLTGWDDDPQRSRLVVDRYSGAVNLLIDGSGRFSYDLPYSGSSSIGMDRGSFAHVWIGNRADVTDPISPTPQPKEDARLLTIGKAGSVSILDVNPDAALPKPGELPRVHLDARRGTR